MGNRGSRFLEISQAALNEMRERRGGEVESGRQSHAETWKMDTKAAIISHSNVKQEKEKHDKKRVQRMSTKKDTFWVFKVLWNLTVELLFTPQDVRLPSPFGKT